MADLKESPSGGHRPDSHNARRTRRRKRALLRNFAILVVGALGLTLLTTEGVDHQPYMRSTYHRKTAREYRGHTVTNQVYLDELQAGFGQARLTPALGAAKDNPAEGHFRSVPLAGYGDRRGKPATGVHDDLWVKAVAIRVGPRLGILAAADALIIPPEVCEAAFTKLQAEFGIEREQLYLGATHSHCSIGGWGEGKVPEGFAGPFNPGIREWFARQIVAAVRQALGDMKPAALGYSEFTAPESVRNRLVGELGKTDPEFSFLLIKQNAGRTCVLGSFSAHATVLSSAIMEFSGDYPGAWQRAIETSTGGMAMFMAGGVGSHSPAAEGKSFRSVDRLAVTLANRVLEQLPGVALTNTIAFSTAGLEVTLPSPHIRVTDDIRLRPWLARRILPVREKTFLQVFRIDKAVWISTPCDFSGELALGIKDWLRSRGYEGVVTSFNGDYIGYVIPTRYYHLGGYEARLMSFFGPNVPDYLDEWIRSTALVATR